MIDSFGFTCEACGCFYFTFSNSTNRALHVVHVVYQYESSAAGSEQEPNAMQR